MGVIYQNYNQVSLQEENGEKVIKKKFGNWFCWQNESNAIKLLGSYGIPVPRIISTSVLENTYEFVEKPRFDRLIKQSPESALALLSFSDRFSELPKKGFFRFDDRKRNIENVSSKLVEQGNITLDLAEKIRSFSESYKRTHLRVVHGDFRPPNFFGEEKSVEKAVDFEFTGIDDPNKDLAYLWVGSVEIDKSLNRVLKEQFQRKDYYDKKAFEYWLVYIHLMIASNPRNKNIGSWITNLRQILGDA